MNRRLLYVAGPFAPHLYVLDPERTEEVALNVARANALTLFGVRLGFAPICVHAGVLAGAYGKDDLPTERAAGLDVAKTLARATGTAGGSLWVLQRDNGDTSNGSIAEHGAYTDGFTTGLSARSPRVGVELDGRYDIVTGTWADWTERMTHLGTAIGWRFPLADSEHVQNTRLVWSNGTATLGPWRYSVAPEFGPGGGAPGDAMTWSWRATAVGAVSSPVDLGLHEKQHLAERACKRHARGLVEDSP